jgi:tetratricopeptide (TPR) repeat protein
LTDSNLDSAALEQRAMAAYEADRFDEAIDLFSSARTATDDPSKSAELANSLSVILLKQGRNTEALEVVRGTSQVFEEAGDIGRQARATGNLAAALEACGELDEAEKAYRSAADLLELSGDDEERMLTLNALSQLQLRQRRPFDAAATLQAGVPSSRTSGFRARLIQFLLRLPSRLLRS